MSTPDGADTELPRYPGPAAPRTGGAANAAAMLSGLRDIVSDPIQKLAFIHQARAFQETLRLTQKNIESTRVLSIIFPAVFGGGVSRADQEPVLAPEEHRLHSRILKNEIRCYSPT